MLLWENRYAAPICAAAAAALKRVTILSKNQTDKRIRCVRTSTKHPIRIEEYHHDMIKIVSIHQNDPECVILNYIIITAY